MTTPSPHQSAIDILQARQRATIDVASVRNYLHGDEENWETHQRVVKVLSSDPTFDKSQIHFLTRTELYKRALAITTRLEELRAEQKWSQKEASAAFLACDQALPVSLHAIAFEPVVMSQGSPELVEKYGALIANRGIVGCYLQTELGHGSNVAQLETIARYIPDSQEFEIDSPTVTSTKWWIGCLGKTATHGVVQARLILPGGKDMGPHLFFVQLRSMDDHKVLPGIRIGDIGPKAMGGMAAVDNGFARFNHVRIPRSQMLSKFAQVTLEGEYVQPPHSKLSYGGMLYIRSTMVGTAGRVLSRAATISIRYATVRRQGNKENGLETQVIMYPSTYYRLLPILSRAYVYRNLGRSLSRSFDALLKDLSLGNVSKLAEMHAITSGLKILVTTTTIQDIETARRSMGGHGFSAFSGLGKLYADQLPSATYEGDNFVLDQQVVRAALKSYQAAQASGTAARAVSTSKSPDGSLWDVQMCIQTLQRRMLALVKDYATHLREQDASVLQRVSRAVSEAFVAGQVGKMIEDLPLNGKTADVVRCLYHLYLLVTVESALVDILSFSLLPSGDNLVRSLRLLIKRNCETLLTEAIGLTDAFGYTDWELNSALGVYDGRVYETLWNKAQTEPLNSSEVPDGYEDYIKPMLLRGQELSRQSFAAKL